MKSMDDPGPAALSFDQQSFQLTADMRSEIEKILAKYETKRAALLPVLNLIQGECGFISPEAERAVAQLLELPLIKVREVVSFYTLYQTKQKGRYSFNVCRNMSCYLCGVEEILEHLKYRLGIDAGETTKDGQFSLSTVECLGACELAPMMQLNDRYVGPLTKEFVDELMEKFKK